MHAALGEMTEDATLLPANDCPHCTLTRATGTISSICQRPCEAGTMQPAVAILPSPNPMTQTRLLIPVSRPIARSATFPIRPAISGASSAPASSPRASGCRPANSSCGPTSRRRSGLVFLWGALLGVMTQFFLNMEIERYTLATGETAVTGFNRFWKHWGLVLAILVYFANLWPGWVDELGDAGDLHVRRRRRATSRSSRCS